MRIKLLLRHQANVLLPFNYYEKIQAWIYHVFWQEDSEFAAWLHDQGYRKEETGKNFKYFTFSNWRSKPYDLIHGKGLRLRHTKSELTLSFYLPKDGKRFIQGLFANQKGYIQAGKRSWDFYIESLSLLPEPKWKQTMTYQAITPILLARAKQNDEKHEQYPLIHTPELAQKNLETHKQTFLTNLQHKLEAIGIENSQPMNLIINSNAKKRARKVKNLQLIGSEYTFTLSAPVEMQKLGYYSGFGKNNSLGFGFCEVEKNESK